MIVVDTTPAADVRPATASAMSITGRDYVSWSQLDQMRRCPQKFLLSYVEPVEPQFVPSSLVFGGAVHSALEAFYRGRLEGQALVVEDLHDAYRTAWADRDDDAPIRYGKGEDFGALDELAGRMFTSFVSSPDAEVDGRIIGIEETLRATLDYDLPDVLARIDLAWQDDTALHVVDFKTSRSRWSEAKAIEAADQLLLYSALVDGIADDAPIELHFTVLTKAKTPVVQTLDVPVDHGRLATLIETMKTVWSAIEAGNYYASPSPMNCSTCPFKSRCPAWSTT